MTEEEFAAGIDAILLTGGRDHQTHRALDLWWTRYAMELPHDSLVRAATVKWIAAIEGDHTPGKPYPLGRKTWWRQPLLCKFGGHAWIDAADPSGWSFGAKDCTRCGAHEGGGNPCP